MGKRMHVHIAGFFYKRSDHTKDAMHFCVPHSETSMTVVCNGVVPFHKAGPFKIYPQLSSPNTELIIECSRPVEEGYYNFSIWNEKGQAIQKQELWIDKDAKSMNLEVPGMITGDYYLQILNAGSGYMFREKVTIGNGQ
jgi:hypothetical protein